MPKGLVGSRLCQKYGARVYMDDKFASYSNEMTEISCFRHFVKDLMGMEFAICDECQTKELLEKHQTERRHPIHFLRLFNLKTSN